MAERFRYDLIPAGTAVLCALSGGRDSMYLLCRLLEGAESGGYTVRAAHYDHRLRPTAGRDADFVREQCRLRGVPLTVGSGDVAAEAARLGLGVEDCARRMRYRFLEETAAREGCALIATGHHAGDNAETVLMNLVRGSGLRGLSGIPERRGKIVRPMLAVSREEIEAYLGKNAVTYVDDETNGDDAYTRNKVRHQLIPLLEELNPQAAAHIADTALRLRGDEEELSRQGELLLQSAERRPDGWAVPAAALAERPRPIALRAAERLLERAALAGQAVHLEGMLALAASDDPSARLDVPGGTVRREYGWLVVSADTPAEVLPEIPLAEGAARWGDWTLECAPAVCPGKAYVTANEFYLRPGNYTVRSRRTGDRLRLGRRPEKTVKKLLIDAKIPLNMRERLPVLDCGGNAAALGGFGPDAEYLARPGASALHIILTEEKKL